MVRGNRGMCFYDTITLALLGRPYGIFHDAACVRPSTAFPSFVSTGRGGTHPSAVIGNPVGHAASNSCVRLATVSASPRQRLPLFPPPLSRFLYNSTQTKQLLEGKENIAVEAAQVREVNARIAVNEAWAPQ